LAKTLNKILRISNKNFSVKAAFHPTISISGSLQTNYSNAKNNTKLLNTTVNGYTTIGTVEGNGTKVLAPNTVSSYRYFAGGYGSQLNNNFGNGVSLNISVPIFNGGSARTNLKKALLNVKTTELQQQQDTLALKQQIYSAYIDATTSLEVFNASARAVTAAQKEYDFTDKRYSVGLLNLLELITIQSKLFAARLQQASAQYDYIFKVKVLEFDYELLALSLVEV